MDYSPSTSSKTGSSRSHNVQGAEHENKLTQKFLRGEISFAEYSNEWYGKDEEEIKAETIVVNDTETITESLHKEPTSERKKYNRLSPALLGLMGEANLRFVRGEKDVAEKMCYEIIRQVPTAPEPYQTLAQIYENDMEKSLQFSLVAAHLSPSDANEWLRLASISKMKNDPKQEMVCYTQAIKAEPQNLEIHMKRLELLASLEEIKFPTPNFPSALKITKVKCYHKIVTSIPADQGETIMKYMKMAASIYHGNNEIEKALEVMAAGYKKCSELFTLEDTNLFLELLIAQKQYETCIEVFVANAGVEIEAEIETLSHDNKLEERTNYLDCKISSDLPIDLRSKLIICFVHLGATNLVRTLLQDFLNNDVDKAGDLYMDIEEALSSTGEHELALALLDLLLKNPNYDLGAVWLKHAECLLRLQRDDAAAESYRRVLQHAPQHHDARLKLFQILERRGDDEEALRVLEQDRASVVSAVLLREQCRALRARGRALPLLAAGEMLLLRSGARFRSQAELRLTRLNRLTLDILSNFRNARGEPLYNEDDVHFDEDETFSMTPQEEWELFTELLQIGFQYKKYNALQRITFSAFMSKNLASRKLDLDFYCVQACILNQDYSNAYQIAKEFPGKFQNNLSYNLLGFVGKLNDDTNFYKSLVRRYNREKHETIVLMLGNNLLSSGRPLAAIKYFLDYNEQYKDALSALLIGVSLLTLSMMRTSKHPDNMLLQGVAYIEKYGQLRQFTQEFNYNMGRAFQMLSLNNLAIEYYERALASPPAVNCEVHGPASLTQEAAFNLSLLYKDHAPLVARSLMAKYIVI